MKHYNLLLLLGTLLFSLSSCNNAPSINNNNKPNNNDNSDISNDNNLTNNQDITIKFVDDNDSLLEERKYKLGEIPFYHGTNLSKDIKNKGNTFYFKNFRGWDKEIVPATKNVTYKATYDTLEVKDVFTFSNLEGDNIKATLTNTLPNNRLDFNIPEKFEFEGKMKTIIEMDFKNYVDVKTIRFPNSIKKLSFTSLEIFSNDVSLKLPENLEEFSCDFFSKLNLAPIFIYIPKSVKIYNFEHIWMQIPRYTSKNLIYFEGTEEEFKKFNLNEQGASFSKIFYNSSVSSFDLMENEDVIYERIKFNNENEDHIFVQNVKHTTALSLNLNEVFKGNKIVQFNIRAFDDLFDYKFESFEYGDDIDYLPTYVYAALKNLKVISLPRKLKEIQLIYSNSFSLESIYIPKTLEKIDIWLANIKNIINIYYEGSESEFKALPGYKEFIENNNFKYNLICDTKY